MSDIEPQTLSNTPLLSNRVYEWLKTLVQLWFPASATLYFSLAAIWNLPNAEAVVATSAALATFGGVVLKISTRSYEASDAPYQGTLVATSPESGKTLLSLELNMPAEEIPNLSKLSFKVDNQIPPE
jgi:hypothetical protein